MKKLTSSHISKITRIIALSISFAFVLPYGVLAEEPPAEECFTFQEMKPDGCPRFETFCEQEFKNPIGAFALFQCGVALAVIEQDQEKRCAFNCALNACPDSELVDSDAECTGDSCKTETLPNGTQVQQCSVFLLHSYICYCGKRRGDPRQGF